MTFDENISMLSLAFYKVIMICGPSKHLLDKTLKWSKEFINNE